MSKANILLIDDDDIFRESIADYLIDHDFSVKICKDGQEAMDELNNTQAGDYQLILLDWGLPPAGENRLIMKRVKEVSPYLVVIAFTGLSDSNSAVAFQEGAALFLQRPFELQDLENVINDQLIKDAVYSNVASLVKSLITLQQCFVWKYYDQGSEFRLAAWSDPSSITEEDRKLTLKVADQKIKRIVSDSTPGIIRDLQNSSRNYHTKVFAKRHGWHAMIYAPLQYKGELVGLLECFFDESRKSYPPVGQENLIVKMVGVFADQSAESIFNAEQGRKNNEVTNFFSSLSSEQPHSGTLLKTIATKAAALAEVEAGWVYMVNFKNQQLSQAGATSPWKKALPNIVRLDEDNLISLVARNGKLVIIDDLETTEKKIPIQKGFHSFFAIAVRQAELIIGVLIVASERKNAFSEGDKELIQSFNALASAVINESKLRVNIERISAAVLKSYKTLQRVVIHAINDMLGTPLALWLWDDEMTEFIIPASIGISDNFREKAKIKYVGLDDSLIAHTFITKQPLNCEDIWKRKLGLKVYLRKLLREENWRATLILPILNSQEQPLGAVALKRETKGKFSQYQVDLLNSFAKQLAFAFENHQRQSRLSHLVESGQMTIHAVTHEVEVLESVARMGPKVTGAPSGAIYPYDPDNKTFSVDQVVRWGLLPGDGEKINSRPRVHGLAQTIRQFDLIVVHNIETGDMEEIDYDKISTAGKPFSRERLINEVIKTSGFIKRQKIRSFVGISLKAREGVVNSGHEEYEKNEIGVLYINYRSPHHFSPSEIDVIKLFAQQLANLIRTSRLFEKQQEEIKISNALVEASQALSQANSREDILRTILDHAFKFIGKSTGGIVSIERNHTFQMTYCHGYPQDSVNKFNEKRISISGEVGSLGKVARDGIIFESKDTRDSLEKGEMVDLRLPIPDQLTNIPIFRAGEVTAILILDVVASNIHVREALISLAHRASIALERVMTFEERSHQMESLTEINDSIGRDADPTKIILEQAVKLFNADYGGIALSIPATKELVFSVLWEENKCKTGAEIPPDKRRLKWNQGITGYVARTGEVRCIDDVTDVKQAREYLPWYEDTRSELAVPLIGTNKNIIGVLDLESKFENGFGKNDADLCRILASMAAAAIEKSALLANTEELNRQLEGLHDIVQQKDIFEALLKIASGVNTIMDPGISSTSIAQFDEKEKRFISKITAVGPHSDSIDITPRESRKGGKGWGWHALETGEPLFIEDTNRPPKGIPRINPALKRAEIHSTVVLPLIQSGHKLGVLYVHRTQPSFFDAELRKILTIYASQASSALENAYQFKQRRDDIAALQRINEAVTSKQSLSDILDLIVKQAVEVMPAEFCDLWLGDENTGDLVYSAHFCENEEEVNQHPKHLKAKTASANMQVYESGREAILDDIEPDTQNYLRIYKPARSELAVPMDYQGKTIGTLNVESRFLNAFDQENVKLLRSFANQAASAIENSKRLAESKKSDDRRRNAEKMAAVNRVSSEFVHSMNNLAAHIPGWIELARENLNLQIPDKVKINAYLAEIEKETKQLLERAQEIREASQRRAREPISINALVKKALYRVRSSQPFSAENITLNLNLNKNLPTFEAERDTLLETLVSIINNGLEAMPKDGTLSISTSLSEDNKGKKQLEISVQDTGMGIPPDLKEKIFEPFFTTKETGMGFGLWRDKTVIEELGGRIDVKSEENAGSTFTIIIPI